LLYDAKGYGIMIRDNKWRKIMGHYV